MIKRLQISLVAAIVAVFTIGMFTTPVAAHETDEPHEHAQTLREEAKNRVKERVQGRLDEAKKRVCAKRSDKIKKIMDRAATQGQRHLNVFTKIADRVKEFYAKKGLSVADYQQLAGDVDAKKAAAETAIKAVKDGVSFDCNGDNPIGAIDQFKEKVRTMHQSLKNYRSAVKNLLVAVKTAASQSGGVNQ